jgi:hypothetical protein
MSVGETPFPDVFGHRGSDGGRSERPNAPLPRIRVPYKCPVLGLGSVYAGHVNAGVKHLRLSFWVIPANVDEPRLTAVPLTWTRTPHACLHRWRLSNRRKPVLNSKCSRIGKHVERWRSRGRTEVVTQQENTPLQRTTARLRIVQLSYAICFRRRQA